MSKFDAILKNLKSSNPKNVYKTLVDVRSRVSKNKNDTRELLARGLVPQLLQILGREKPTGSKNSLAPVNICLSLLGNLFMEYEGRKCITLHTAARDIPIICKYVLESQEESLQNRCVRTLANLALDRSNMATIAQQGVMTCVAELLEKTSDTDCQQTYIRFCRLFWPLRAARNSLTENGVPLMVAKLLASSPNSQVQRSSLRALAEMVKSEFGEGLARQVLLAGVMDTLVTLAQQECSSTSSPEDLGKTDVGDQAESHGCTGVEGQGGSKVQGDKEGRRRGEGCSQAGRGSLVGSKESLALDVLLALVQSDHLRHAVGAAGGVTFFMDFVRERAGHPKFKVMLSALCLCAKDSVNRVKIREGGGLELLLQSLESPALAALHDRVLSGLVCFLYDEASLRHLLANSMVSCLITHLHRCAHVTPRLNCSLWAKSKLLSDSDIQEGRVSLAAEEEEEEEEQGGCQDTKFIVEELPDSITTWLMEEMKPAGPGSEDGETGNEGEARGTSSSQVASSSSHREPENVRVDSKQLETVPGQKGEMPRGNRVLGRKVDQDGEAELGDEAMMQPTGSDSEEDKEMEISVASDIAQKCIVHSASSSDCEDLEGDVEEELEGLERVVEEMEQEQEGEEEHRVPLPQESMRFSIHSPTYQAASEWSLETFSAGAKCKSAFNGLCPSSSPESPFSPMSHSTLYSPASTSSLRSPAASPRSLSSSPPYSPPFPGSPSGFSGSVLGEEEDWSPVAACPADSEEEMEAVSEVGPSPSSLNPGPLPSTSNAHTVEGAVAAKRESVDSLRHSEERAVVVKHEEDDKSKPGRSWGQNDENQHHNGLNFENVSADSTPVKIDFTLSGSETSESKHPTIVKVVVGEVLEGSSGDEDLVKTTQGDRPEFSCIVGERGTLAGEDRPNKASTEGKDRPDAVTTTEVNRPSKMFTAAVAGSSGDEDLVRAARRDRPDMASLAGESRTDQVSATGEDGEVEASSSGEREILGRKRLGSHSRASSRESQTKRSRLAVDTSREKPHRCLQSGASKKEGAQHGEDAEAMEEAESREDLDGRDQAEDADRTQAKEEAEGRRSSSREDVGAREEPRSLARPGESSRTAGRERKGDGEKEGDKRSSRSSQRMEKILQITETNITQLLSVLSQRDNPGDHLAKPFVISGLLDYLVQAKNPALRCVRVLVRVLRDLHSFQALLIMGAPLMVVDALLVRGQGMGGQLTSAVDCQEAFTMETQKSSGAHNHFWCRCRYQNWSHLCMEGSSGPRNVAPRFHALYVALELLDEMQVNCQTWFGRDVISKVLQATSYSHRLTAAISLLTLAWTQRIEHLCMEEQPGLALVLEHLRVDCSPTSPWLRAIAVALATMFRVSRRQSESQSQTERQPPPFPRFPLPSHETPCPSSGLSPVEEAVAPPPGEGEGRPRFQTKLEGGGRGLVEGRGARAKLEREPPCSYEECQPQFDVTFLCGGEEVGARREVVVAASPVFAAMLEGHYLETHQSQVTLRDTSAPALTLLLHFLHGCGPRCPSLQPVLWREPKRRGPSDPAPASSQSPTPSQAPPSRLGKASLQRGVDARPSSAAVRASRDSVDGKPTGESKTSVTGCAAPRVDSSDNSTSGVEDAKGEEEHDREPAVASHRVRFLSDKPRIQTRRVRVEVEARSGPEQEGEQQQEEEEEEVEEEEGMAGGQEGAGLLLDLLALADRYVLGELATYLKAVLRVRYLTPANVLVVLLWSSRYHCPELGQAIVAAFLQQARTVGELCHGFHTLLARPLARELFLHTLESLIRKPLDPH